jgi:hypothetical protein
MSFAHVLGVVLFLIGILIMLKIGRRVAVASMGFSFRGFGLTVTAIVTAVALAIGFFILLIVVNHGLVTIGLVSQPSSASNDFSALIWLLFPPVVYVIVFGFGAVQCRQAAASQVSRTSSKDLPARPLSPQSVACLSSDRPHGHSERSSSAGRYVPALVVLLSPVLALLCMHLLSWMTGVEVGGMGSVGFARFLFALSLWGGAVGWVYAVPIAAVVFVIAWITSGTRGARTHSHDRPLEDR